MPTAYTEPIESDPNFTFEAYALRCARAFGALVSLRDEPLDAPLPDMLYPSTYYEENLKRCDTEYAELIALSPEYQLAYGEKLKADNLTEICDILARNKERLASYSAMKEKVLAWEPPTASHAAGLSEFMLNQLDSSARSIELSTAFWDGEYQAALAAEPLDLYRCRLGEANQRLVAAKHDRERDLALTAERNQWLADLRASLGLCPATPSLTPEEAGK